MTISSLWRPRAALLAAVLLPVLASCGGGGGSGGSRGTTNNNAATPVPISVSDDNCDNNSFTPNYAASVSLLRWNQFPLRVHFSENSQLSDARRATALAGFDQWVASTAGRADYRIVAANENPNVRVSFFRFTGGSGSTLGTTTVTYDGNNIIRSARIEIGITGSNDNDILTSAHEYGHTIGITGHSPDSLDLMFFQGNRSGDVTTADLNTARTAYCDDFNRSSNRTSAAVGPLKTLVMH